MQRRPEIFGPQLPVPVPVRISQQHLLRSSGTHLARIAVVLRGAPQKRLTFSQLLDEMKPLMCEDGRSIENTLRVCLSTNKCFVKIPVDPDSPTSKRNYWTLDPDQVSEKMVRRHFKGIVQFFPELASKVETPDMRRAPERRSGLHPPYRVAVRPVLIQPAVKFSSPFSIDSLLEGGSPSAGTSRSSPLTAMQVELQQQPPSIRGCFGLLPPAGGSSSIWPTGGSTHHGLFDGSAAAPIRRMDDITGASFSIYTGTRAAPYLTSPPRSYPTYSAPGFTHHALCYYQ